MKKCRQYVLALMMAAAVLSMTACGSMGDDGNSSAAGQNTTGAADGTLNGTTGGTINGTTGADMNVGEDMKNAGEDMNCLLYTSPRTASRCPAAASFICPC